MKTKQPVRLLVFYSHFQPNWLEEKRVSGAAVVNRTIKWLSAVMDTSQVSPLGVEHYNGHP